MSTVILNPMNTGKRGDSVEGRFRYEVGGNTGNLMFVGSIKEQVDYSQEISVHLSDATEKARRLSPNDVVAIPASNFIIHNANSEKFYQNFIDFVECAPCPITMIGLGAQGSMLYDTPKKLVGGVSPLVTRFLKTISDHSVSIGIRGNFTAECLDLMGIHNYKIIGCPSFYNHFDGKFLDLKKPSCANVQINITPGSIEKTELFKMDMRNSYLWIIQSLNEIPRTKEGTKSVSLKWRLRNHPTLLKSSKDLMDYYEKCGRIFFDLDSWDRFYKENDISFVFGTRFHGNMIALRNGVPALWVTHDSRTKELVDVMHLPNVDLKIAAKAGTAEELLQFCDYEETAANYSILCKNYVEFLNENHIDHKFNLQ